jgi:hypothetical protein
MKIPFLKKELRYIVFRIVPLLALTGGILYCHRPIADTGFDKKALSQDEFHEVRQVIWVNADSLLVLIKKIQEKEPHAFTIKTGGSEWTVTAKDTRAFERIFLDGEPLSNWDVGRNPSIDKLEGGQGFSVKAKTIHGSPFVRLPAEIMQSIQISN